MSTALENMLNQLDELSASELVILLESLSKHLRQKTATPTEEIKGPFGTVRGIRIPGAYQFSSEEIEAELAEVFTPEELAEMDRTDISNLTLPPGAKTTAEILSEDREDRF